MKMKIIIQKMKKSENEKELDIIKIDHNNKNIEFDSKSYLLKDITFSIKKGEFIAILGPTGSGKSCLLNAILNNYFPYFKSTTSKLILNGEVSYANQQPWVMTDTVKNNIIFNNPFDEDKYDKIIFSTKINMIR